VLASISYVPVLRAKVAEVTAFRNLSEGVKSQTFPLFLARPWPNANFLDLTTTRILEAAAGYPFALGLDAERRGYASGKPAQNEFNALFESRGGYRAFYDWVDDQSNAVPVLQSSNDSANILLQLGHADRMGRGLVVHVTRDRPLGVLTAAGTVPPLPHDTIFVIDAGWGRSYELLEAWSAQIVARIASVLPDAEIVVAASSFPDSFSEIVGHSEVAALEFRLFQALRQRFNRANLTYGDWGSTRPSQSGGGGKIPPRIDIPVGGRWNVFRADPDGDEDYGDVANDAATHGCFSDVPNCFGKQMVLNTPGEGGITGPAKATEARINMHMTICSDASRTIDTHEVPYQD
jgi:hypothetical protein